MKKLFISVPMRGRTEEAIKTSITKMKAIAEAYEGEELELIDSYMPKSAPENVNQSIWCLGRSIEKMAEADVFIGCGNAYGKYPGCDIEVDVARCYQIKTHRVDIEDVCPDLADIDATVPGGVNDAM